MAQFIDTVVEKANEAHDKVEASVQALRTLGNNKFAHSEECCDESGGLLLTADGCMSRNYGPRIDELNERTEETYSGGAEYAKEIRMWGLAYDLLARRGLRPKTEDLEEFVKVHLELEEV